MKKNAILSIGIPVIFCLFLFFQPARAASTISGIIYDYQRNALPDVDVELYGETSYRSRSRTDSTGRYQFDNLGDGRFTIRILPLRYDYEEQSDTVVIQTISSIPGQSGADYQTKDFYLKPRKGSLAENEATVIFAQEIPPGAKKAYEKGIKEFSNKKPDDGFASLNEAVKIFPNYYLALHRLGREHYFRGKYGEAVSFMIRAADINNKSGWSFYFLGSSLLKLNYYAASIIALNQAYVLSPSSVSVLIALGTAQRLAGKFKESEKSLKQAIKFSNKEIPEVHRQLALLYSENLKQYADAAREIEEYLKAKPDDPDAAKLRIVIKNLKEKAVATTKTN